MKTFVLYFVLLLPILTFGQYQEVLTNDKSWNYYSSNFWEQMDSCVIHSDSLIGQTTYKVIVTDRDTFPINIIGFVREDTLTGKVWKRTSLPIPSGEILVYDLSLGLNDSIEMGFYTYFVDSVYYQYGRKHIRLHDATQLDTCLFIEGIGTTGNMFITDEYSFDYNQSILLCAYDSTGNIFTNTYKGWINYVDSGIYCRADIFIGNNKIELYQPEVSICPNPSRGFFYIKTNQQLGDIEMNIYNMMGQKVRQPSNLFINHAREKIDVSFLKSGVYIINLTNDRVNISRRLIVE